MILRLVGILGLGPRTSSLSVTRSNQLSYMPKKETTNWAHDGLVITRRGERCSNQLSYMPKKETTNWVMMASSLLAVASAALTSASRRMSYMPQK